MEFDLTIALLITFGVALGTCIIVCGIALGLFPWFRSGERKPGDFKAEDSGGSMQIDRVGRNGKAVKFKVRSSELPLVGGPAMLIAISAACLGVGYALNLNDTQWILMAILLLAMLGYGIVGFVDDVRKVYRGTGISEIQKFIGVTLVSLLAAIAFNRLIIDPKLTARLAYSPYFDTPFIGHFLVDLHFTWIIFFLLLTVTVASSTSLAVDFTDGMDGLSGGLMLSAALAFAVVLIGLNNILLLPAILVVLAMAGASLGYLPFNWPSSWGSRGARGAKRRAKLIMGDSGSLALGGLLALVALISRLEFLLIIIGGVFLLEGLSALISARILVRFFRHLALSRTLPRQAGLSAHRASAALPGDADAPPLRSARLGSQETGLHHLADRRVPGTARRRQRHRRVHLGALPGALRRRADTCSALAAWRRHAQLLHRPHAHWRASVS